MLSEDEGVFADREIYYCGKIPLRRRLCASNNHMVGNAKQT